MKVKRFLSWLLTVMMIMTCIVPVSATTGSGDMFAFDPITYTEGENVVVKLYITDTTFTEIELYSCTSIWYDTDVFEYVGATTEQSDGVFYDYTAEGDPVICWTNEEANVVIDHSKPLIVATFSVKDGVDKADVYGTKFMIDEPNTMPYQAGNTTQLEYDIAEVVVEAPEPEEKIEVVENGDGTLKVTYPEGQEGALDGKTLVKANLGSGSLTDKTRFNVTYNEETKQFGGTMWADLGLTGQGEVEVNQFFVAVAFNGVVAANDVAIELVTVE